MAVRSFSRTTAEKIEFGVGTYAPTGAYTIVAVVKRVTIDAGGDFYNILYAKDSGNANRQSFEWVNGSSGSTSQLYTDASGATGGTSSKPANSAGTYVATSDGWVIVAVSKAAGSAAPRFYVYKAGAWTIVNGATAMGSPLSVSGGRLRVGTWGASDSDKAGMEIAAMAGWNSQLSDATIQALAGGSKASWLAQSPAFMWQFDQASTATTVLDVTGNGADQALISGTTVVTGDDPPAGVYNLSSTTVVGASLVQPATVLATRGASLAQPATVTTARGASLVQPATVQATGTVGASLVQPATVTVTRGGSLTQPATVLRTSGASLAQVAAVTTLAGGSLAQPAAVIAATGASIVQPATVHGVLQTVGGSLVQRATVRRMPVKLGPGVAEASSRHPVRTRAGYVYVFIVDDTPQRTGGGPAVIRCYKSDQAGTAITSFTEADTAHHPSSANGGAIGADARLDPATGIVHVAWTEPGATTATAQVRYARFDTTTNLWTGSIETVTTGVYCGRTSSAGIQRNWAQHTLCLDADGTPTVAYCTTSGLSLRARTAGTWSAATVLTSADANPHHPQLLLDRAGDLHLAWLLDTAGRYMKRAASVWGSPENTAPGADTDGFNDNSTLDQAGSIAIDSQNRPIIMYVSANATDFVKIRRRGSDGTWTSDNPTRVGKNGVYTHTPQLYVNGDDVYAFLGHGDDAAGPHPAYAWKPASRGSWLPGDSTGSYDVLATASGQVYVAGTPRAPR